ncbi:CHAT domain-containing protein [Flavobacterium gawalongense]|uniref:CHAT domain-containing protein n=1 Tax=Flavobacterium gawalongense TaxID=2594432 RepID=A0A553BDD8_9FLAO|nr:CHAT domain-containing protein [Flavobacterium gawalongense]TRX01349.1 CHAT domain-containing protein [Flavobacterium gawalongense]TRX05873.1 CHAT domain-containing protein [Flavobacterium gawalongense]TRX06259.1 CHAT domain-containing protein [Flavobacterium gawalongense]TRX07003.1 CHAT domain-containing protein [Flavobacterium gawalongense]TRX23108.1 CHAT domain-containing protein [Flavobacterium gawalongense]
MKKITGFILFIIYFPFAVYSQQWHQYSDSIISSIRKNDLEKASRFIELADIDLEKSNVIKDTIYADYLYRKGIANYFQSQYSLDFFKGALAIWDVSTKKNYSKVMNIHYFIGENYRAELNNDLAIKSYEKCYEINKKYHLPKRYNFSDAIYYLAFFDFKYKNYSNAKKYAEEYIEYNNETGINQFNFKYASAFEYKNDLKGQEEVLLQFLTTYNQKKLNNPILLFRINYELFLYYNQTNKLKETINYGEKAYEIYQKENLNSQEDLKLIILILISRYGELGDNINHDKYERLQYSYFPEDEENDYYSELDRLMKAGDFDAFKIKFNEYEGLLISKRNYDDLLDIYTLSITLFEQNALFKKGDIVKQIELIQKNKSSLSAENKLYFDMLLAEFFVMTNDYTEALKICNMHLNEKDVNLRLLFYKYKSICEMSLANGDAKKTAYKTLEIANSIYAGNDPQLLPYLSLILTVDVMGEDTNTTKIASKSLQILYDNKLEHTEVAIGIWHSLGNTAFNKKNLKDARVYYEMALQILESTKLISNSIYYYSSLLQLANVNMLENNFEKSLEYSNKVKLFLDNNTQIPQLAYGDYYDHLGHYYFYQDKFVEAKINYEKSFAIYGKNISNIRKINYILCDYFIDDDVDKTILSLEKYQKENKGSVRVLKIIYLLKFNSGDLIASRNILVSQLKTLISDNNQYFHLLSDNEKEILYKGFSDQFEFLNTHLLSNDPSFLKEYINFRFYSKSLLFSNAFKVNDDEVVKNQELYSELKSNTILINKTNESKEDDLKGLEDLKIRNREIEKFLSAKNAPLIVPTLKDLNLKLKVNEAYVEIIRINKQSRSATKKGIDIVNQFTDSIYYGAIVIKKNTTPKFIVLDDTNLLESNYFPDFQNHIQGKNKLEKDAVSYHLLFEKIDHELSTIDKIYLVTDGVYNSINVESIYNPNNQKYILDYLKVQLIQNVKRITDQKEFDNTTNLRAALFGNPDFDIASNSTKVNDPILERDVNMTLLSELKTKQKIGYLLGTEKEIQSVNAILKEANWSVDLYSMSNASEDNIKKLNSPDILHIATHGFFNKNSETDKKGINISNLINDNSSDNSYLKSGLLLAGAQNTLNEESLDSSNNGILSAEEAKGLDLKKTELVVLSACETGLGDNLVGEGVIGLQRAFMIAGAKSVIMSLWKVDDASAQKLMALFYTNWIKNKMSKSDAFYAAKLEMKKMYPQPYYWAGFVLLE